jgi:hypothetical protein
MMHHSAKGAAAVRYHRSAVPYPSKGTRAGQWYESSAGVLSRLRTPFFLLPLPTADIPVHTVLSNHCVNTPAAM